MTAATKNFSHLRDVKFSFAAQAHAKTSARKLAKKCSHFHLSDRKHIVHKAFAVFLLGAVTLHLFTRHPRPADVALGIEIA